MKKVSPVFLWLEILTIVFQFRVNAQGNYLMNMKDIPEIITMSAPKNISNFKAVNISDETLAGDNPANTIWHWLSPLPQGNTLLDIGAPDSVTLIAVGEKGTIIRTSDKGQTWAVSINSNNLDAIEKVVFVNDTACYAIGWYETIFNRQKIYRSFVLRSRDRGLNWRRIYNPVALTQLSGGFFITPNLGYIAGTNGFVAKTTNGGADWNILNTGSNADFQSVYFQSPMVGYISTRDGKILRTSDGGSNWQIINVEPSGKVIFTINFISPNIGIAAGCEGRGIGQDGGFIYRTTDAGLTWTRVFSAPTAQIFTLGFFNAAEGVAFGSQLSVGKYQGKGWRSADSGRTWTEIPNYITKRRIFGCEVTSLTGILVVAEGGVVIFSSNRGGAWARLSLEATDEDINDIHFISPDTGMIACTNNIIFRTTDGGIDWKTVLLSSEAGDLTALDFGSYSLGLAVNNKGKIFRTINAGGNWTQAADLGVALYDIEFATPIRAFCIGMADSINGKLFKTQNAGLSFSEILSFHGAVPSSIFFIDSLYGYITLSTATGKGFIYKTTNGGVNWDSIPALLNHKFLRSYFTSRNTGFVLGNEGKIFKTTNGGMSWKTDSLPGNTLSDIQFMSQNQGIVTSLNGRIFYTTNAGDNWERSPAPSSMKYRATQYVKYGRTLKTYAAAQAGTIVISTVSPFNEKIWNWTGAADSSWFNHANWSPPKVPDFTDSVVIAPAPRMPVIDKKQQQVVISALTVKENGKLIITDSIKAFVVLGDLTVEGRVIIKDSAKVQFIIGGSWDISPAAAGTSGLGFDPGKSQVVFSKNGRIRSRFYDVFVDSSITITSSGKLIVWNNLTMYYGNIDLNRTDTLVIQTSAEDVFAGPGIVPNGTISRVINPLLSLKYRFESEDTYIKFRSGYLENYFVPGTISFTTYPGTDPSLFGTVWETLRSTVDTVNNVVVADSVTRLGVYALGTVTDNIVLTRVKRVVTGGGGASDGMDTAPFELSIRYEQGEVPPGFDESAIRLLILKDTVTNINKDLPSQPVEYSMAMNYPNPFNPSTKIRYTVPEACKVTFTFYNSLGQGVSSKITEISKAGNYEYIFDASGLASGVYFYKMEAEGETKNFVRIAKCILLK